jgi:hypothetical protein
MTWRRSGDRVQGPHALIAGPYCREPSRTGGNYLPESDIMEPFVMRAILLWVLGIPIPIIILLYLFGVFH